MTLKEFLHNNLGKYATFKVWDDHQQVTAKIVGYCDDGDECIIVSGISPLWGWKNLSLCDKILIPANPDDRFYYIRILDVINIITENV